MLPQDAFYGRGPLLGPSLGLTDDSEPERKSLRRVWPNMVVLLCHFHVLQAHWQWLFASANKIEKVDKPILLQMMRRLLYSQTSEIFQEVLSEITENPTYQKYPNYVTHMQDNILPRKDEWSLMFRIESELPTNNVNCSNYCEVSFRITKDLKFGRNRAYNLVELVEIECDDSSYYTQRCVDIASNTLMSRLRNQKSRFLNKTVDIDPTQIIQEEDGTFSVPSETKGDVTYSVDMELRICSCPDGRLKGPCKHRKIVASSQNLPSFDVIPNCSPQMRAIWMEIGTGKQTPISYFQPLSDPNGRPCENSRLDLNRKLELEESTEAFENTSDMSLGVIEEPTAERVDRAKAKLDEILENIRSVYTERMKEDICGYEKALKSFENHVTRMPKTNDAALQKALFCFGESVTMAISVQKRKKGSKIPVQVTAKARRRYKIRGSRVAAGITFIPKLKS